MGAVKEEEQPGRAPLPAKLLYTAVPAEAWLAHTAGATRLPLGPSQEDPDGSTKLPPEGSGVLETA